MSFESLRPLNTHCFQLRPIDPGRPRGPWGPWIPCSPSSPFGPWGPGGPWGPWLPVSPGGPRSRGSFRSGRSWRSCCSRRSGTSRNAWDSWHATTTTTSTVCHGLGALLRNLDESFVFFGSLNVGLSTTRENSKSKGSVKNLSMHTISFSLTLHSERAKGMFPLNKPLTNFFFRYNNYNFCHSSVCNFKLRNVILRNIAVL